MSQNERAPGSFTVTAEGAGAADLLAGGPITLKGRVPWSSNATFVVEVGPVGGSVLAIYKPERGERPLWDFEPGLWKREVAAYELAKFLGWDIVPVTVGRPDAPLGPGSLQLLVEAEADEHYFTLMEQPALHEQLRRLAAFDAVANNADRKSGHCLLDAGGHIWGIDHGLCFHPEPKLRTVIWDFAGDRLAEDLLSALAPLAEGLPPPALAALLGPSEVQATLARAARLVSKGRFPRPVGDFPYPWPLV